MIEIDEDETIEHVAERRIDGEPCWGFVWLAKSTNYCPSRSA